MRKESPSQREYTLGDERSFLLPLGYVDSSGRCHREVRLRPMTGREQQLVALLPPTASTAVITTELLARCVQKVGEIENVDAALVRDLLVGDREVLLLRLYQTTFGEKLYVRLQCQAEACAEITEVLLNLEDVTVEASPVTARAFAINVRSNEDEAIRFRLPTGGDQEALANMGNLTEEKEIEALLKRCLIEGTVELGNLSNSDIAQIEEGMMKLAPPIEVELGAVCPKCSTSFTNQIDVPFLVLNEMKSSEASLDFDIHTLAFYYHWTESEIALLTPRKRARYTKLLEDYLEKAVN